MNSVFNDGADMDADKIADIQEALNSIADYLVFLLMMS